jgi:rare lipoprotein A (peptidoglycan hydrolase)
MTILVQVIIALTVLAQPGPLPETATELHGTATWYCGHGSACTRGYGPGDLVAAIDRKDTPYRKGDRVRVRSGGRSVVVRIVDVCACRGRRVIDLTSGAFSRLAPLSRGVIPVTLEGTDEPLPTLPATDVAP